LNFTDTIADTSINPRFISHESVGTSVTLQNSRFGHIMLVSLIFSLHFHILAEKSADLIASQEKIRLFEEEVK
jgi:hypothetical protein